MLEEQLVSFETAKLAKEKGFDLINVHDYYHINKGYNLGYALCISEAKKQTDGCLLAPTQSLLQKWLREIYKLHITIFSSSQESWMFRITKPHQKLEEGIYGEDYDSFEEALEDGLQDALELIKL